MLPRFVCQVFFSQRACSLDRYYAFAYPVVVYKKQNFPVIQLAQQDLSVKYAYVIVFIELLLSPP